MLTESTTITTQLLHAPASSSNFTTNLDRKSTDTFTRTLYVRNPNPENARWVKACLFVFQAHRADVITRVSMTFMKEQLVYCSIVFVLNNFCLRPPTTLKRSSIFLGNSALCLFIFMLCLLNVFYHFLKRIRIAILVVLLTAWHASTMSIHVQTTLALASISNVQVLGFLSLKNTFINMYFAEHLRCFNTWHLRIVLVAEFLLIGPWGSSAVALLSASQQITCNAWPDTFNQRNADDRVTFYRLRSCSGSFCFCVSNQIRLMQLLEINTFHVF